MARQKSGAKRYHMHLYEDDYEFLKVNFPDSSPAEIIRMIVNKYVKNLRERALLKVGHSPKIDLPADALEIQ